jgi:hypothetical protein
MEQREKGYFKVPYIVFGVIITIILAVSGWGIATATINASDHNQIQVNTKIINDEIKPAIVDLTKNKVDKADMDRVYVELKDIKLLLMQHMDKK